MALNISGHRWGEIVTGFSALAFAAGSAASPCDSIESIKLVAPTPEVANRFGFSVAIDGDIAAVGEHRDDHGGVDDAGSVHVFERIEGAWIEQLKIPNPEPGTIDFFGVAVDLNGDTLVVGAPRDDRGGYKDGGSAYVFVRNTSDEGAPWTLEAKLAPGDDAGGAFGNYLTIEGDTIVIGAPFDDPFGLENAGSAYVFVRTDDAETPWAQQAKLVPGDPGAKYYFGRPVAISGDTILAGAYADDHSGLQDAGSAYIFVRERGTWTQQAKLIASDPAEFDHFAISGEIEGDRVVLGAFGDDFPGAENAGSAYIFERIGPRGAQTWVELTKLVDPEPGPDDRMGWSTSILADRIALGVVGDDHADAPSAGSVRIFELQEGVWSQVADLQAPDAEDFDQFGTAVALHGESVVIGSWGDDVDTLENAGSAYIFDLNCLKSSCDADLSGDSIVDGVDLGLMLGAWEATDNPNGADLNDDGIVDGVDLGALLSAWGACP
jgi:hypothetical protein